MSVNSAMRVLATKVAGFAFLSGLGLTIDIGIFTILIHGGIRAGYANLVSATLAVAFVYFSSAKRVFKYNGRFLAVLFACYSAYQVVAVVAASFAIDRLVSAGLLPIVSKILVLPVTFTANYLSMSFLLKARQ